MTPTIPGAPQPRTVGGRRPTLAGAKPRAEREPGEDDQLVHGVVALDVAGRIGLGIAERLGVREDVA